MEGKALILDKLLYVRKQVLFLNKMIFYYWQRRQSLETKKIEEFSFNASNVNRHFSFTAPRAAK